MMHFSLAISTLQNIIELLGLLIVFILILVASYYTTRWIGKAGYIQPQNRNIKVIETHKLSANKYIQIVQVGKKYLVLGISKDHIAYLSELEEDTIDFTENKQAPISFKDIMSKVAKKENKSNK